MSTELGDVSSAKKIQEAKEAIVSEISKAIIGQTEAIEQVLISLFARGHCLIMGVPGLAKTLLISSLAQVLDLKFSRIQFTPDLMPSDVTGSEILQEDPVSRQRSFRFMPGPIFANMILADEINRTPPKTQASVLEAMQEFQVTVAGSTRALPLPFFVMATENPIEQEGTYPLPEAQLDRFFLQIKMGYPSEEEERLIIAKTTGYHATSLNKVLSAQEVLNYQTLVRKVPLSDSAARLAVGIVRQTRPEDSAAPDFIKKWILWGAGPRAGQALVLGAKARAVLSGRLAATEEDVKAVSHPVLRHRLILNFQAEADGVRSDDIISRLIH
jgi:MoxR-like ATPase